MRLPAPRKTMIAQRQVSYLYSEMPGTVPVLLLHGGGLDRASLSWRCLFPALATQHTVIAPDWPGYGDSAGFKQPYRIADLHGWLIAFMDTLDIDRADMVGISMGGGVALLSALDTPDRVRRLIPVGTYGVQEHTPYHFLSYLMLQLPVNAISYAILRRSRHLTRKAVAAIFADPDRVSDGIVEEVMETLHSGHTAEAFSAFQRAEIGPRRLRTVLTDRLAEAKPPALFIHGAQDALVPLADVRRAARIMPNARLEVLQSGHWPMRECPEAFNALVMEFLGAASGPT
ncbi:alpha/beta fold hydrolase [Parasphingopyxis sp.]|uniref:alpha/beta fold hydrolase n=1 Tax=Parasphingopyxis sp. TaxID=1920299 RepID=UPI00261FBD2C|nr:alpha/beta fold hydrolase [Parasphingopyxis sp.]